MVSHRFLFYAADVEAESRVFALAGDEHHHSARVLRARAGDELFATNGRGLILRCVVSSVGASSTAVETVDIHENRPPGPALILALATIRKEKFAQALEQCVEMGITRCVPYVARASAVKTYTPRFLARLRKISLAAMKQSFRAFLTQVESPVAFDDLVEMSKTVDRVVVGSLGDPPVTAPPGGCGAMAVVGPEAGLSDDERAALAEAGAVFASVSTHRLRSETAAVALVSALGRRD